MMTHLIFVICGFAAGVLAGFVLAVVLREKLKSRRISRNIPTSGSQADLSRVVSFARKTEEELKYISGETAHIARSIAAIHNAQKNAGGDTAAVHSSSSGDQSGFDDLIYHKPQETAPEPPVQQQAPASAGRPAPVSSGIKLTEMYEMIEELKQGVPEYRMYNTLSGKVEYTTDPDSDYILRIAGGQKQLLPNRMSTFSVYELNEATYKCSVQYIRPDNHIIPCIIDDGGNIVSKGIIT